MSRSLSVNSSTAQLELRPHPSALRIFRVLNLIEHALRYWLHDFGLLGICGANSGPTFAKIRWFAAAILIENGLLITVL